MELKNTYFYFKEALSPETCKKIIDLGVSRINEATALGKDTAGWTNDGGEKSANPNAMPKGELSTQAIGSDANVYVRDSQVAWLNDQWLYDTIVPLVREANERAGWNWEIDSFETFQFTVYNPGGFYSWHRDGGSDQDAAYKRYIYGVTDAPMKANGSLPNGYVTIPNLIGKVRKISLTINLNVPGDYDGGNLKFDFGNHVAERYHECEEIRPQGSVIVFPSFLNHCVTPVTRGTRYSLVLWCLGKPFK